LAEAARTIDRGAGVPLYRDIVAIIEGSVTVMHLATASPAPVAPAVGTPADTATTVATAIALELRALGVEHFFLMTGRDNQLWIALESLGIRQVLTRSESAAVYMADAYARLRGRPTFVYGAYGPGAANVAGSLAEPFWSGSPVIALTSAMRRADRMRKEYQELDQPALFASVTKWGVEASVPTHVPRLVREAARHALSGAPGPVYLGIPNDLFETAIPDYREPAALGEPAELPLARPAPTDADAEAVVRALTSANRPIILAGNGIHQSGAHEALRRTAERLGIPVATSSSGKGSISETHELALGSVGRYSRNYANAAMRDADVILAIGTQLGGMATDSYRLISSGAHLIHVTVDPEVIGQNFPTQLGLVADARAFLEAVLEATDRLEAFPSLAAAAHVANLTRERAAWRERRAGLAARDGSDGSPMRPEAVMAAVEAQMAGDAVLVADTGYAAAWAGALAEVRTAGRHFLRADGSLGWAFPASLGAQLAAPDRQVICITGDGGFGYHIGDIETAVRLQLPVVVIVLNNQTLVFEAHVQSLLYGHVVPEVNDFCDVDYGRVARAFGAAGFRATNAAEFNQALAQALERRGPTVIDAVIDRDAIAPVTRYDRVRIREL
jgi:acetolactate synthase-1/2/3 large subunit